MLIALVSTLVLSVPAARAEDLAKRYPSTMSWSEQGLDWRCDPLDVWQLKSFSLEFGKDFELSAGKASVALGVHGTNVVWAVVFPEQPATLRAKGRPGDGEQARTIFLRFAPAELARVFPSKTVGANGDPWLRAQAGKIFRRKIGYDWYTPSGNPTIVPGGVTLVDLDTAQGKRRFYKLDSGAGQVTYLAEFESQPVPADAPVAPEDAERVFDEVWRAFDAEYANFVSLPKLDWRKLGDEHKKQLGRVATCFDLAAVVADTLVPLEDLHVWVKCGDDWLPQYSRERPLNGSWKACEAAFGGFNDTKHDLMWARTEDGLGYLNVHQLGDAGLPAAFDAALESLADTWGLVVDLRFNGGGDESLAQAVAARFVDQERIYSTNQYRSGPGHADLGPVLERKIAPRGPWSYQAPVVALFGQRTMSSAESFALMLAQCPQVTTMGDRTAGSSANPRHLEPGCGITVNLPRWRDMDSEGHPIEHVGVAPKVALDFEPAQFTASEDPVLSAALARLRKTPRGQRKPGKP